MFNSSVLVSGTSELESKSVGIKPRYLVALACLCAVAGLTTIHAAVSALQVIWRTDDLKSMGLVVPFICGALILREWRSLGWRFEGSWWGFALLAATSSAVFLRERMLLVITVDRGWLVQLPPLPVVAILYAASLVLLFGGVRLLRRAWFPVLLMGAVIPVPHIFSLWVDLPLQHASATVARAFAHALGQQLTEDNLRLMFTPDFGMFIAPGCNGIRGAVTLGLAAIVVGYIYRLRWFVYAPAVAGAVLLGYLFNFVRLCLLVIYYEIALPYPWLQVRAKGADYIIGGCLFLAAMFTFIAVVNRLRRDPRDVEPPPPVEEPSARTHTLPVLARVAAILALASLFGVDAVHAYQIEEQRAAARPKLVAFPQQIGEFSLVRTWTDTLLEGTVVYAWGEYAAPQDGKPGSGAHISLGISPVLGAHDTTVCHLDRGEEPAYTSQLQMPTAGGQVAMSLQLYNEGKAQKLEAATVCAGGSCRQYADSGKHLTVVYTAPQNASPLRAETTRPVPVLLKAYLADTSVAPPAATERLAVDVRRFLAASNLPALTQPYSIQ